MQHRDRGGVQPAAVPELHHRARGREHDHDGGTGYLHDVTAGGVSGGAGGGVQHCQRSPLREGRGRELRAGAGDTYLHISTHIYTIYKYLQTFTHI